MGSSRFIKEKLRDLNIQIKSDDVFHRRALRRNALTEKAVIAAVAKRFKMSMEELCASRSRPIRAKQIAIYLLRRHTALTNREIGEKFGMGHSAVSKAGLYIEQLIARDKGMRRMVEKVISNFEV